MHDVKSKRRENLQTQSEASMPASSNHFTTLFLAIRFFVRKLATTFGSLQRWPEIIDILYPDCAQFIEYCFQCSSSISRQANYSCIHHRISKSKLS